VGMMDVLSYLEMRLRNNVMALSLGGVYLSLSLFRS
jgi:hypothetical protein